MGNNNIYQYTIGLAEPYCNTIVQDDKSGLFDTPNKAVQWLESLTKNFHEGDIVIDDKSRRYKILNPFCKILICGQRKPDRTGYGVELAHETGFSYDSFTVPITNFIIQYSKQYTRTATCPNCGCEMGWDSDVMSEECGYEKEGKVVSYYTCRHCGTLAEFAFEYEKEELEQE